jgi:hypothetical protein
LQEDGGQVVGIAPGREIPAQNVREIAQALQVAFFLCFQSRFLFNFFFLFSTLSKCFESQTNPNYKIMEPLPKINVTTQTPPLDEQLLTENYPNYIDYDDNYYKNVDLVS